MRRAYLLLALLVTASCQQPTGVVVDGIAWVATASLRGAQSDTLVLQVRASNPGFATKHLDWGACVMDAQVRLATDTVRFWGYRAGQSASLPPNIFFACPAYGVFANLRAGAFVEPKEFRIVALTRTVLGDSLPNGRYRVFARMSVTGAPKVLDGGEVMLSR